MLGYKMVFSKSHLHCFEKCQLKRYFKNNIQCRGKKGWNQDQVTHMWDLMIFAPGCLEVYKSKSTYTSVF